MHITDNSSQDLNICILTRLSQAINHLPIRTW